MKKKEFLKLENWIFEAYRESLSSHIQVDGSNQFLNVFPLFHNNVASRLDVIQSSNMVNFNNIGPSDIENFPIRGYLKISLFIRLILIFLLFAANMKGFNFPLFLSFLAIYYW